MKRSAFFTTSASDCDCKDLNSTVVHPTLQNFFEFFFLKIKQNSCTSKLACFTLTLRYVINMRLVESVNNVFNNCLLIGRLLTENSGLFCLIVLL